MAVDLKTRLNAAVARRDQALRNVERIQGRLDSARKTVSGVEAEISQRGVDPENLDSTIEAIETKLHSLVGELETRVEETERGLAPFLGDDIL